MREIELLEINRLWEPVRPYLVEQVRELYDRTDGAILEIGPFSGLIFTLAQQRIGDSFMIAAFPESTVAAMLGEARSLTLADSVSIIPTQSNLDNLRDESADLIIFRGALFFPSLFQTDFAALYRVLRVNGVAFVGGGYGSHTPPELIARIGERSRELNLAIGKVDIEPDGVRKTLDALGLPWKAEIITNGGLWVVIRK